MSNPAAVTLPHTPAEDVLGMLTGTYLASLGLYLLHTAQVVTGGTAGLSLLITYVVSPPFSVVFFAVNVPFFALALWKKGWGFTAKSVLAVALVSAFSTIHEHAMPLPDLSAPYAVVTGNLLAGVALLILFRHNASLGGFGILAVILQERVGWRAGYVQMALDVVVVASALFVVPVSNVALSAVGAVILNLVLAFNHRPERYRA